MIEPTVVAILDQIGSVTFSGSVIMVLRSTTQDPADVSPPTAIPRRVWITMAVCMRVMNSMGGHPLNWSTFEGQRATRYQKIFDYLGYFVTAVSKQTVKTHAYT